MATPIWALDADPRSALPVRSQVVEFLRRAILDLRLTPGQRLVERELVESLGVSRATIREALGELKSEGLVTVIPQRGATVAVPDPVEAAELYEIRIRVEALVIERFVERAAPSQLLRLEAAVEAFAEAVQARQGSAELLEARDEIFTVLLDGASSSTLTQVVVGMQARLNILRAASLADKDRIEASVQEWRDLVEALRLRRSPEAVQIYSEHLRQASVVALASLAEETQRSPSSPLMHDSPFHEEAPC